MEEFGITIYINKAKIEVLGKDEERVNIFKYLGKEILILKEIKVINAIGIYIYIYSIKIQVTYWAAA